MGLKQLQEQWLTKWDEMHSTIAWPHIFLRRAVLFYSSRFREGEIETNHSDGGQGDPPELVHE